MDQDPAGWRLIARRPGFALSEAAPGLGDLKERVPLFVSLRPPSLVLGFLDAVTLAHMPKALGVNPARLLEEPRGLERCPRATGGAGL